MAHSQMRTLTESSDVRGTLFEGSLIRRFAGLISVLSAVGLDAFFHSLKQLADQHSLLTGPPLVSHDRQRAITLPQKDDYSLNT